MNVRLRQNLIIGGKFHVRGSLLDDQLIPERLRDVTHVAYDLEDMGGKVMVLREVNFNVTRVDAEGIRVTFPVMKAAGELISVTEIPDGWVEGTDYTCSWTPETRRSVQDKDNESFLKQFQPEPFEPAVATHWRNR